jgi:hypothetical protein
MKAFYTLLILLIPFIGFGQDCSELFFSEYVEGSSQNKALEIFNPTPLSVDLNGYTIERYQNGSSNVSDQMNLIGSLLPGQTWVIVSPDTNTTNQYGYIQMELYNLANQIAPFYPSPVAGMNGNDALTLSKNGFIVDIIGKIGEDPGVGWTDDLSASFTSANGVTSWTANHTLVRKESIKFGITTNPILFNPAAEWDTLSINDWSNLGFHECDCISNNPSFVLKKQLIEGFESSSLPFQAVIDFQNYLEDVNTNTVDDSNILAIKYHMNWPGQGSLSNNQDSELRRLYYNINSIPGFNINGNSESINYNLYNSISDTFVQGESYTDVVLSGSVEADNNLLSFNLSLHSNLLTYYNLNLHIAIIENNYNDPQATGVTSDYYHVMRKMFPDGNGTYINQLNPNTPYTYSDNFQFEIGNVSMGSNNIWTGLNNCKLIVFVQENDGNILQSEIFEISSNIIQGCIDLNACNYDENATIDDGSCNYPSNSEVFIESCENIEWNGMLLDETGLYSYLTTNSNDCDSTVSLDFTLFNSNYSIENISSCESYLWNDEEYTETGMYTFEGVNANGCDSTVIIDLVINELVTENIIYGNPEPESYSASLYSVTDNGNTLQWIVQGGNIIENNGNSINIQWGNQSIGLITLVESNEICDDFTNVYTVNVGGQIETTWDCNANFACVELTDGSGNFQSLEECEANCLVVIEDSWNCVNDACVDQMDGSGEYGSLNDCEANCTVVIEDSWNCLNDACVDPIDGSGAYNSLDDCEANCTVVIEDSWNCLNDACVDPIDGSGAYNSLDDCEANCSVVIEDSWNCLNDACIDPMDGTGIYSSLNVCEQECQSISSIYENDFNINIYPNPSSNIFNLEFDLDSKAEILVTNVLGEQVYVESTKSIGEFNTQIDLSNYSKGIYNLTIKTSDGISNHKLILQ